MRSFPMKRAILISLGVGIVAMAFAGIALSLGGANARRGPTPEQAAEAMRKAPGTEEKAHAAPRVDGQTWELRSYANVRGEVCLSHDVPGELVGTGCIAADRLFRRGPLYAIHGARQDPGWSTTEWANQWVYGIAHPDVRTLTLVNIDCSTQELSLDQDGAFNHAVGREQIKNGEQPYKLVARASGGAVLAQRILLVGLTRNAKDAGLEAPRPKRACS
jgi:hypothetical protein